jgi:hypothetical protein
MPELAFRGSESAANLAQGLGASQLAEQHGHELSPTAEAAGVSFGLVLPGRYVKASS